MNKLIPCEESEATHVQILPDERERFKIVGVTPYGIYRVHHDPTEDDSEIINDNGEIYVAFSLIVPVRWLKEVSE